jgi:hypothetical protein
VRRGLPGLFLAGLLLPQVGVAATGLGVIAGEPTGVSIKAWLDGRSAIDGAMAWSMSGDNDLHLHGDYLLHFFDTFAVEKGSLPLYTGVGARLSFDDDFDDEHFGMRIPLGISYLFEDAPLDAFLEVAPTLDLAPDTDLEASGAVGLRYYFGQ